MRRDAETSVHPRFLLAVRLVLAVTWLYEGLWQKILAVDAHELNIVEQFAHGPLSAGQLMVGIGLGESLLAAGILSGMYHRFTGWFQFGLLALMNGIGILFGNGTISHPVDLLVHNLPLFACMVLFATLGGGSWNRVTA